MQTAPSWHFPGNLPHLQAPSLTSSGQGGNSEVLLWESTRHPGRIFHSLPLLLWDIVDTVLLGNLGISGLRHRQMPGRAGVRHVLCRVSCLKGAGSEGDWGAGRDPTFPKGLAEHSQHLPRVFGSVGHVGMEQELSWSQRAVPCMGAGTQGSA